MPNKYINININKPDYLEFTIEFRDTSLPNAIRRVIATGIPIYALDANSIIVDEHDSIFSNERVIHSLSMIPINNNDAKKLKNLTFSLDKEYKDEYAENSNLYDRKVIVYSNDIIASDGKKYFTSDVPITEFHESGDNIQKLRISSMNAKKSTQKISGAGFQACLISYKIISRNPNGLIVQMGVRPCDYRNGICYPLNPVSALFSSILALQNKLDTLESNLDDINIENDENSGTSKCIINNEDDTLGHLLDSDILASPEFEKRFCGYKKVHPLKNIIEIIMTHNDGKSVLRSSIKRLRKILNDIENELNSEFKTKK